MADQDYAGPAGNCIGRCFGSAFFSWCARHGMQRCDWRCSPNCGGEGMAWECCVSRDLDYRAARCAPVYQVVWEGAGPVS
ncbi:MAG TPA: hypothetical protein EYP90_04800 [Chromatiaceae bacterium]|nr:hypothetical protein [Chromatiaceae bacterium]